jgi:hemolysin III
VIKSLAWQDRTQSLGEEIANSVSHGVGLLAALAAAPVLVLAAVERNHAAGILGASVFAVTMVLLYLASTLYHAIGPSGYSRSSTTERSTC